MDQRTTSKFLSLVLRHKPETIDLQLDHAGWAKIDELLTALARNNRAITREQLNDVVNSNDKQRFIMNGDRIRANQGHSISVDLELSPQVPPDVLFHGTATRFLDSIFDQGILKMKRQHVHLSPNLETASRVGVRHGKLALLEVASGVMDNAGYDFYQSENGVWLVDHVPSEYLGFAQPND